MELGGSLPAVRKGLLNVVFPVVLQQFGMVRGSLLLAISNPHSDEISDSSKSTSKLGALLHPFHFRELPLPPLGRQIEAFPVLLMPNVWRFWPSRSLGFTS